jgi:hypothetical protein
MTLASGVSMRRFARCLAVASLALLGACGDDDPAPRPAAIGAPLDEAKLCQLRIGQTSADEVLGLFGPAPLVGPSGGRTLAQYVYVDEQGVIHESTLFWFDGPTLQRVDRVIASGGELPECLRAQQP